MVLLSIDKVLKVESFEGQDDLHDIETSSNNN